MIEGYTSMLEDLENKLKSIGYALSVNEPYCAEFADESRWRIRFEGERFSQSAFGLQIVNGQKEFSVEILMNIFNDNRIPSFVNQIEFLVSNVDKLMKDNIDYEEAHRIINEREFHR